MGSLVLAESLEAIRQDNLLRALGHGHLTFRGLPSGALAAGSSLCSAAQAQTGALLERLAAPLASTPCTTRSGLAASSLSTAQREEGQAVGAHCGTAKSALPPLYAREKAGLLTGGNSRGGGGGGGGVLHAVATQPGLLTCHRPDPRLIERQRLQLRQAAQRNHRVARDAALQGQGGYQKEP